MQGFIHHSFAPQECTTKHSYIELFIEVSEPSQKSRCNVFLSCGYPFCPFLWFFPLNFGNVPPVWYLLFFIFFFIQIGKSIMFYPYREVTGTNLAKFLVMQEFIHLSFASQESTLNIIQPETVCKSNYLNLNFNKSGCIFK